MHFFYALTFISLWFWSSVSARATARYEEADAAFLSVNRGLVRRNGTTLAPACASTCLDTYIPQYCGSVTNTTCVCTNTGLTTAVTACAYTPCSIPDMLQLQRYSAETCGVKNDRSKINEVLLMDYIVPALTTVFLIGRVSARRVLHVGLGYDDWVIISAYFAYIVAVATSLGLVLNKFGEHVFWLTTEQVIRSLKFFFYTELFYMLSITLTKLSLLLFFLRIFPSRKLIQISWALGIFIVVSNFAILIALGFQCVPFHGYWTNWMYKSPPVHCIDQFAALNVAAGLGIFHNVAILALPVPTLWGLNLPWQRKLNLLVMFSVGSFVVVCSCLRLPSLAKLRTSGDVSYDQAPIIVFSHLEEGVGLMCACLPACRSLVEHFIPSLKMSHMSSRNKTNGALYPGTGSKHGLGTSARSFIELHDRMPDDGEGKQGGHDEEEGQISLQDVLAGAPSGKGGCKKEGCKKLGFGHETRVAGGGKELPESIFVPRDRMSGVRPSKEDEGEKAEKNGVGIAIGEIEGERDRVSMSLSTGKGHEGVIVCTKTIEFEHEKASVL